MLKKLFFCLFLILWSNCYRTQNLALDSLKNLVYSYLKEDSTKVRLLFEYHNFYVKNSNYDSMFVLQARAGNLASILGDAKSLARVNMMQGKYFYKKNLYQKSINSFNIASVFLEETDRFRLKYDVHTYLGVLYFKIGYLKKELDSCILHYKKALFFSKYISKDIQVKAVSRLSQAFSYVPMQDSVFFYNNKILEIAKTTNEIRFYIKYYASKYNYYSAQNLKDSAFRYMNLAYNQVLLEKDSTESYKRLLNAEYERSGMGYYIFGEYDSAYNYLTSSLLLSLELKDYSSYISSFDIVSSILIAQEKYENVLDLSQKAISLALEIKDSTLIAKTMYNTFFVYLCLKENKKAIEVSDNIIDNYLTFLSKAYQSNLYQNKSHSYFEEKDYVNAVRFGLEAYQMEPEDPIVLFNLADAYLAVYKDSSISNNNILPQFFDPESIGANEVSERESNQKVLNLIKGFYEESIFLLKKKNDLKNLCYPHLGLADYYDLLGNYKKVIYHYKEAWKYSKEEYVVLNDKLKVSNRLYELYKGKHNCLETLKWLEIKDSLEKIELSQNDLAILGKKQAEFEYIQKIYADSLEQDKKELENKFKIEKQKNLLRIEENKRWYFIIIVIILLIFVFYVMYRNRQVLKQNGIISNQKELILESKNKLELVLKDVQDSIVYSKRLQEGIMPNKSKLHRMFKESFVFFQPKDVISGDFYWFLEIDEYIYVSVADCTGHGVPGAILSVIGINGLRRAIVEKSLISPSEILEELSLFVSNSFKLEKGEEITDGMDLSLCVINKNSKELSYAGANNSIYILKENEGIGLKSLLELKATRKPIGKSLVQTPFENQYFKLKKGDSIYLFSDGFPDQFGGDKGKKYKYKKFKEFIISLQNLPFSEQESSFRDEYLNWVGDKNEQLDDITIVGIKM